MKALKIKSILFSLFAVMAVAVFLTSCEQEREIIGGEEGGFLVVENDSEAYDLVDLPASPDEVWAAANAETNHSDLNNNEGELNLKSCSNMGVRWINGTRVKWKSNPQYALWIYHYDSNDNWINSPDNPTREDVTSCATKTKRYYPPSGTCKSVAFVGYQSWDPKTIACK